MKKLFCLIMTLIMVLTISSTCFAAEGEKSDVDKVDLDAVRNVDVATYDQEKSEKEIDKNKPDISPELVDIEEQTIPEGLPSTGGIPAEAFYVAGALFVVAALVLSLKKTKPNPKN